MTARRSTLLALALAFIVVTLLAIHPAAARRSEPPPPSTEPTADIKDVPALRVTFKDKDLSGAEAYKELAKQAGVELMPMGNNTWTGKAMTDPLGCEVKDMLFWEALLKMADKTGVGPSSSFFFGGQPRLMVQDKYEAAENPACVSGPFLIMVSNLGGNRNRTYGLKQPPSQSLTVSLTATSDPKLLVDGYRWGATLDKAEDEQGRSLLPKPVPGAVAWGNAGMQETGMHHGAQWRPNGQLDWPRDAKTLVLLHGFLEARIVTKTAKWEIESPLEAKNLSKTIGNVTYTIKGVRRSNDRGSVKYDVDWSIAGDPAQSAGAMFQSGVLDYGDGKPRVQNSYMQNGNNGNVGFFIGKETGEPEKLVFEYSAARVLVKIPFEFKDLALP